MKRITVFCGSSLGTQPIFEQEAHKLGQLLAQQGIGLVYGGAKVGLMGAVANGVLSKGGEVIGVIPRFLRTKEVAHEHLTELVLVETMHERKTKMNELCQGVIALPGGFGTSEELFEMLTWAQLGLHQKPIGLLNVAQFYDPLHTFVQSMLGNGFIQTIHQDMLLSHADAATLLQLMTGYKAPEVKKWITPETT